MEITASGQVVGYILQKQDFCNPKFQICDADKKVLLELKGPVCVFSCCCNDIDFDVSACNFQVPETLSKNSKKWTQMLISTL